MNTYIRYPFNMKLVIAMLILALMSTLWISRSNEGTDILLNSILTLIYLSIISLAVIRRFLKPKLVQFANEALIIHHSQIAANDIKQIYQ